MFYFSLRVAAERQDLPGASGAGCIIRTAIIALRSNRMLCLPDQLAVPWPKGHCRARLMVCAVASQEQGRCSASATRKAF